MRRLFLRYTWTYVTCGLLSRGGEKNEKYYLLRFSMFKCTHKQTHTHTNTLTHTGWIRASEGIMSTNGAPQWVSLLVGRKQNGSPQGYSEKHTCKHTLHANAHTQSQQHSLEKSALGQNYDNHHIWWMLMWYMMCVLLTFSGNHVKFLLCETDFWNFHHIRHLSSRTWLEHDWKHDWTKYCFFSIAWY